MLIRSTQSATIHRKFRERNLPPLQHLRRPRLHRRPPSPQYKLRPPHRRRPLRRNSNHRPKQHLPPQQPHSRSPRNASLATRHQNRNRGPRQSRRRKSPWYSPHITETGYRLLQTRRGRPTFPDRAALVYQPLRTGDNPPRQPTGHRCD